MITQLMMGLRAFAFFSLICLLSGCATLNYYAQSMQGQFELMHKQQKISALLDDNTVPDSLRNKLHTVLELRDFSINRLGLPENDSYFSYADIGRDYVIWNIFANPEFSLEPLNWCYLIIGCLSYRGYFSKTEAEKHETQLKQQGYDTYLGGVAAYSTLGWFDDPVLNSMLRWNESYLASVMFHELAHQQLYVKNDTELNESYADAVAHIGVTKWLQQKADKKYLLEYLQAQEQENVFVELINRYKLRLNKLYQSIDEDQIKQQRKKAILEEMKNEFFELSKDWIKNPYKNWFSSDINNAKLAAVITYRKYLSAFLEIYEKLNNDLPRFYSFSRSLSKCKPMKRKDILEKRKIEFEC